MEKNQVENMKDSFKRLIKIPQESNFYSDIVHFSQSESRIVVDKSNVEISKSSDSGNKIRVWDNEKFLEYGLTNNDENELTNKAKELTKQALENQVSIRKKEELDINKEVLEKDFSTRLSVDNLSLEDKTKKLKEILKRIQEYSKDIVNVRVGLIEEIEEMIFVNRYKNLYQNISTKILVAIAYVKCSDGSLRTVFESFVNNDNTVFDTFENQFEEFLSNIDKVKIAKKLKGGKYKAVLAPKLTGLLAHESFGHGMEADTMFKGRALASEWVGKKIGAGNVNIVDYPQVEGKNGEFFFDHEGNIAKKTYLVKNGIINEPMSDVYTKTNLKLDNASNARFESFDHKSYVRMSNTYFEPGDKSVDELIADVEDGIFVSSSSGGMEDPKGWGVQIQGNFGQRIKNGKLVDEYYDGFTLTGFLPDIIKNISGISKDFKIEGGGSCGKGHKEWVRVSEGGPYILVNEVILG